MNVRPQEPNRQYARQRPAEAPLPAGGGGETALHGETSQPARSDYRDHAFISDRAEQLFQVFQTCFERDWVLEQLESAAGVTVGRAETELHVLDLFAVYIAIKRHPAPIWQQCGGALYEQFLTQALIWWGTEEEGSFVPLLENRFALYNRIVSEPTYATFDDMVSGIAILAAVTMPDNCTEYSGPEHHDADGLARFVSALKALEDDSLLPMTAARVFRRSYDAVSQLLSEIASNVTE
jgi:hypothetical protein